MSYDISSVTGEPVERAALADFLAAFVRDGELPFPRPGDDDPAVWLQRFRWWWDDNPDCRPDSPRGFLLQTASGELVGFSGYIPLDYEKEGTVLPSLLATTFFVRAGHRSAVIGLMGRQRTLGKTHQIVDGSPSPEMRRLLEKLGYLEARPRRQYFFPVGPAAAPARLALRLRGWSLSLPRSAEGLLEHGPDCWSPLPPAGSGIRPRKDPSTMAWLCRSGSQARQIFRLSDAQGAPVAEVFGIYKERLRMKTFHLLCHNEAVPGGLLKLLRRLVSDSASGLDRATRLLVCPMQVPPAGHRQPGRPADSPLMYHLPPGWGERTLSPLSLETDLILL